MNCIICDGQMDDWLDMPLDAKKNEPTAFGQVRQCRSCGLGAVHPLPSPEQVAEFYRLDRYYTQGEGHFEEVRPSFADKVLLNLTWRFDKGRAFDPKEVAALLPPGGRILDIGCGPANYLRKFQVLGIEPDPVARAAAEKAGVPMRSGTGEDMPAGIGEFDLAIMSHSLEHCIDPMRTLRNLFDHVKAGGFAYCEVPNAACLHFEQFNICSEMFDAPRHLYFFSPDNLGAAMSKAGFHVRDRLFTGFSRHHSASWRAWEQEIARRVKQVRPAAAVKSHGFAASAALAARSATAAPALKYDTVGILAQR